MFLNDSLNLRGIHISFTSYLFGFPGNEIADGFAEEAG